MMSQIAELAATTSSRPAFVIGIRAKYRKRSSASFDHRHRAATRNDAGEVGSGDAVDHLRDILVNTRHVPLDESAAAYKDIDQVINSIAGDDLASVDASSRPSDVIKGDLRTVPTL